MKTVQVLVLAMSLEFSVYGQSLPDPAHLASTELSDNTTIITNWIANIVGNHIVTANIRSLPYVYKNIGFADVNGDGYPDLCFLDTVLKPDGNYPPNYSATPLLKCALGSLLAPLNLQFAAPTIWIADASTLLENDTPTSWGSFDESIQFLDLNGDGKADVCAVFASHAFLKCMLSNGSAFVDSSFFVSNTIQVNGTSFADHADAVRFADLNNDGKTDVCMRLPSGIKCALSNGSSFGSSTLWSADFSDSNGWGSDPAYWSTIQFADLNGDGLPDVCGRSPGGITCALNNGNHLSSLTPATAFLHSWLWTTQFSDAYGWNQPQYYSTIQLADINGDGRADVCGRGGAGIYCARSGGVFFGDPWTVQSPEFSDANGWNQEPSYRSLWLVDINNDGKADVCGRGYLGIWCALSTATYDPSFAPAQLWISNFGDNYGWGTQNYYWGTVRPIQFSPQQAPMTAFCGRGGAGIWCSYSFGRRSL
jgi:FG-GAP-like repeat